jgi:uncharacterized protein YdhG (YjbR/CyaY superfamily)
MPTPTTVDDYIAAQPPEAQPRLCELRDAVRGVVPEAAEVISYGVPTYKLGGRAVAHFGAARRHVALYGAVAEQFADELGAYKTLKGTVQFPLDRPVPADLVRRMVASRAAALRGT